MQTEVKRVCLVHSSCGCKAMQQIFRASSALKICGDALPGRECVICGAGAAWLCFHLVMASIPIVTSRTHWEKSLSIKPIHFSSSQPLSVSVSLLIKSMAYTQLLLSGADGSISQDLCS